MKNQQTSRIAPALPSILFLMVLVFIGMMPRMLLAPLLLRISADLGITYDRASIFFLTSSVGFITGLFTSGFVAQRLTHKWTIVSAVLLSGLAMIILSRVQSVGSFHLMLFTGGWAIGLYPGSGIASVTGLAPDTHRGMALAIHECGPNLALILTPVIAAALAPSIGWRGVTLVVGISCVVFALIFAAFGRAGSERGQPPSFRNLAELVRNRSFWIISALMMVAATAAIGVYAVLPTYLVVEHGLPERFVNNLVGASRITGFAAILTAGSLSDRFGFRPVVTVILVVTGSATILLGVSQGWLLVVSVFLQPLIVGAYFPVALSALANVTAPERRNLAVALAIPLATLVGSGAAPPLFTAAGARGWFSQAFVLLGILILASVTLPPLMRESE
ncbi:MAG: MFS transporter [Spirochaetaceae bacterium]|nr:MFS transporter [Spirochaetaceae bacterium]